MKPNYIPKNRLFSVEDYKKYNGTLSLESNLQNGFDAHDKYIREVKYSFDSVQDMLDNGIYIFDV